MRILTLLLFCAITTTALGQSGVAINTNGDTAHHSAILDLQSTSQGLLVPRMTTTQRDSISDPGTGLIVFDTDNNAFWCYAGSNWIKIMAGFTPILQDADGDTRVEVEQNADEDVVRLTAGGHEVAHLSNSRMFLKSPAGNINIGEDTGPENDTIGTNSYNVRVGQFAGQLDTFGYSSIMIGNEAGYNSRNGDFNVFIGAVAGRSNNNGNENIFIGFGAGEQNNGTSNNVAIGSGSIPFNSIGGTNTAIGQASGASFDEGAHNTFLGDYTGVEFYSGYHNTMVGSFAGTGLGGNSNIAVGRSSGWYMSGEYNIALGYKAGENRHGDDNIMIGRNAGTSWSPVTTEGSLFIGREAGLGITGDHKLAIDNYQNAKPLLYGDFQDTLFAVNGNMGIGTMLPQSKLHIQHNGNTSNPQLLLYESSESDYARLNFGTMADPTWWTISAKPSPNIADGILNFYNTRLGSNIMSLRSDGDVGIGTTGPDARLHIKSDIADDPSAPILLIEEEDDFEPARMHFMHAGDPTFWAIDAKPGSNTGDYFRIQHSDASDPYFRIAGTGHVRVYETMSVGTSSNNAKVTVLSDGSSSNPQLLLNELSSADYARLNFRSGFDAGWWTVSGKTSTTLTDAELNFYNSELGGNVMRLRGDGRVSIGTSSPSDRLHVNSDSGENALRVQVDGGTKFRVFQNGGIAVGYNPGGTGPSYALQLNNNSDILIGSARAFAWATYSDDRIKSNKEPIRYGLNEVLQLAPKSYRHHHTNSSEDGRLTVLNDEYRPDIGFIAQEVNSIIPEIVYEPVDEETDLWSVDYVRLVPVLVKAVQEQQELIDALNTRVNTLEQLLEVANTTLPKSSDE